jgi:hypothetical protein
MAWFSLAKIALQAGSKIYANRQKTKMAMSDAQLMHAEKMARGEEAFQSLPSWFTNLWILVVASIFGIKGTQIFRNGKK